MNFILYSPISIKPWGPEDSESGIGGIETAITEMSTRLAKRGNDVVVYIDLASAGRDVDGVHWKDYRSADFNEVATWVVYRQPEICTKINKKSQIWFKVEDWDYPWHKEWVNCCDRLLVLCNTHKNYILKSAPWLEEKIMITSHGVKLELIKELEKTKPRRYCFDWGRSLEINESLREHARKVFAAGHEVFLVPALAKGFELPYPQFLDSLNIRYNKIYRVDDGPGGDPKGTAQNKLVYIKALRADHMYDDLPEVCEATRSVGIEVTQIYPDTVIQEEIPEPVRKGRNPRKIVYLSSPDRGLGNLLELMPRIREVVPDLELHIFYGFDGIDDLIKKGQWSDSVTIERMKRLILDTPGVVWRGRVTQKELYEELLSAGMMVYPTMFAELSFIAGMEAQACGAIPVVTNVWAQGENCVEGIKINGDPSTPLVKAQFAAEICRLATDLDETENIRGRMMEMARSQFNWERWVDQWEIVANAGPIYRHTWNCRDCGSDRLETVLDLGRQAIATIFPTVNQEIHKCPLEVLECQDCHLTQLSVTVNRNFLFTGEYGYRSGINEQMVDHLMEIAQGYYFKPGSIVVDVGCNDGTFLQKMSPVTTRIGFDPNASCPAGPGFVRDFFSHERLMQETGGKPVDAIFTLAMFYDLDDPNVFAKQVWDSLTDNGIWVIECQDSRQLVADGAFDFICHEHVTNWDSGLLRKFLAKNHFLVTDCRFNKINGGSVLITAVKRSQYDPITVVPEPLVDWKSFGETVRKGKEEFQTLIKSLQPAKIWGYGASTKGNVLLQYYELDRNVITAIADRNPSKHNRYTPGSNIPILAEETLRAIRPDYVIAFPWAFIDGFRIREPWAKFITPFPHPAVLPALEASKTSSPIPPAAADLITGATGV